MSKKKICEVCKARPATVPDRYKMPGRMTNRICGACQLLRLRRDMVEIVSKVSPTAPAVSGADSVS